jgi:hypothetical protein
MWSSKKRVSRNWLFSIGLFVGVIVLSSSALGSERAEYRPYLEVTYGTTTVSLRPSDDSHMNHDSPDGNAGHGTCLHVRNEYGGGGSSGWGWDGMIRFDVSSIPPGTQITSATMNLYYFKYRDNNPAGNALTLYENLGVWSEKTVTWNNAPQPSPTPSSVATVPSSAQKWMVWDVTNDVQAYINGTPNYGWRMVDKRYWGKTNIPIVYFYSYDNSPVPPFLDIKANGSDGPITLSMGTPFMVDISLAPGSEMGKIADWWVLVDTPRGWFHCLTPGYWGPGLKVSYTGPLTTHTNLPILNAGAIPPASYEFSFGVDLIPNGALDPYLYFDSVTVNIQ